MKDFSKTDMRLFVQDYLNALQAWNPKTDSEYTHRPVLDDFLRAVCKEISPAVLPRHESKQHSPSDGIPDFTFVNQTTLGVVGVLENKKIGVNLGPVLKSAQIKKYNRTNPNILVTNYLEWILLRDGEVQKEASLCTPKDLHVSEFAVPEEQVDQLIDILRDFLSQAPVNVAGKTELAEHLAVRCHDLRDFLAERLASQKKNNQRGRLYGLYEIFRQSVFSELSIDEFADAFAQMLGYSLFLARLNAPTATHVTLDNTRHHIPKSFDLIRELASFLEVVDEAEYRPARYRVEEILGLMNNLNLSEVAKDLAFDRAALLEGEEDRLFETDPYIYFYEYFLKAYDASLRETRGVYYTPPPVVNFIIRGIDEILKQDFSLPDGLADGSGRVTVLDFATGTGTFLLEVLHLMLDGLPKGSGKQASLIRDHVLKNLYGFEYLIAPYTIAHLKLSQFLSSRGYDLTDDERLKVYLTNTLEPAFRDFTQQTTLDFLYEAMTEEGKQAQAVKEQDILVITGNPPYNVKSKNRGLMDDLVKEAYKPASEKKMNWDDYVKFIRFAHQKMEKAEQGVIGIITNNSFLNAITLRRMRQRLMEDFDAIYILNLHGNSLIGEKAPDGRQDASVFDIRVGTAITFLVKKPQNSKSSRNCQVYYASLKSSRQAEKYRRLVESDMSIFQPLDVEGFNKVFAKTYWGQRFKEPPSLLAPTEDHESIALKNYGDFWGTTDIFDIYGSGIKTDRDELVIDFDKEKLSEKMKIAFSGEYNNLFAKKYNIENSSSYNFAEKIKEGKFEANCVMDILYRPFDFRKVYYKTGFTSRPAWEIMQNILYKKNKNLILPRCIYGDDVSYFHISSQMTEIHLLEQSTYIFPLYLYPPKDKNGNGDILHQNGRRENFTAPFRKWLDDRYGKTYTPEQVLGYIYAILHSPTYRNRYQELLKTDFPRIPFAGDAAQFETLSSLGWSLIQTHLMQEIPNLPLGDYMGEGTDELEKPTYSPNLQRLHVNKDNYFDNVPQEVWDFRIGGYQVLDKYLKYRQATKIDRGLTLQEIQHLEKVIKILAHTRTQMQAIDRVFECP